MRPLVRPQLTLSSTARQFSLLLIEAVKVFCSEFESCGDMEQVSGLCGLIEGSLVLLDVRDHVRRPPFYTGSWIPSTTHRSHVI